jgi:hypothetical protein
MIGVQRIPEPGAVDAEQGLVLPVPARERNTIVFEPRDGGNIQTIRANAVLLTRNGAQSTRVRKVKITVFITDARVAIACSKYDKGSTWYGNTGLVLILNAATKSAAAIRRHGKMLVGQVRYPWIQNIGSTRRQGFNTHERLVIEAKSDQATTMRMTLSLPNSVDASLVAAEIARRAARFRLASEDDLAADKRVAFEQMTNAQPLPAGAKNIIQFHRMPSFYFVGKGSARLTPAYMGAPGIPAAPLPRQLTGSPSASQTPIDRGDAARQLLAPLGSTAPVAQLVPQAVARAPQSAAGFQPPLGSSGDLTSPTPDQRTPAPVGRAQPGQKIVIGLDDLGSEE